jgi:GntR family galactonate operon transcriptional repressor
MVDVPARLSGRKARQRNGPPVRPSSMLAATMDRLGRDIVAGRYPAGRNLPVEAELGEALGVGRNTLREAVKVLASKGLLRTARRYGTRVCGRESWNLLDPELLGWLVDDAELTKRLMVDLTEIRRTVEPFASALAAERASADDVEELLAAAEALGGSNLDAVIEADLRFHDIIYRATNNLVLMQLGGIIVAMQRPYFRVSATRLGTYCPNPDQHRRIATAIAARDATGARHATTILLEPNRAEAEKLTSGVVKL